ncbi:MAG: TonB-dependent receptor, plug [Acidobacteria bacterium]|nr:TonB-dependent receptor, plug [Acidobacteriota bacterium]
MTNLDRALVGSLLICGLACPARSQTRPPALADVPIEDLMNIQITSASRKVQPAADVAAAVYVITSDDIRHSGLTTIPDLLRLAPGVDVAQVNSNKWAVSIRGFNGVFANKLLVLVDGRTIYDRAFAGVSWEAEDLMVDDIDRIEVIRGPGAAIWGANAVNGVINIVTKATRDTLGGLVRADAGRAGEQGAVRYGGTRGAASYRVFSQWTRRDETLSAAGIGADDVSHNVTTGFRADWTAQPGAAMVEGSFTAGQARELWPNFDPRTASADSIANVPSDGQNGHLLGRWTHTRAGGGSLQIQSFLDIAAHEEPVADYARRTIDVDTQYHTAVGARQDLVAGMGYRFSTDEYVGHTGFQLTPGSNRYSRGTGFLQDEISLFGDRLALTLGSQVQYDSDTGAGIQPTARMVWKALPHQRVWASTSRALRTPSLYEQGIRVEFPPVPSPASLPLVITVQGNTAAGTETLVDGEAGYRLEIGAAKVAVTGFVGRYGGLQTQEPSEPVVVSVPSPYIVVSSQFSNLLDATTRGLEVTARWSPVPAWRLDGSVTAFHVTPHPLAPSRDPLAVAADANAPGMQWQLRTVASPLRGLTVTAGLFHVGPLVQLAVEGYTRADATAEWRFNPAFSAMFAGQNLLDASHPEFSTVSSLLLATRLPRSGSLRLRWTFR